MKGYKPYINIYTRAYIQEIPFTTIHPIHRRFKLTKKVHQLFFKVDELFKIVDELLNKHQDVFKKCDHVLKKCLDVLNNIKMVKGVKG